MRFEDNKVVGVFDFDWAKVDLRVFELGLALVYFTPYWAGELDGVLQLDKCKLFLEAYQRKLQELGGLSPLNETEKKYLPEFINTGNIYLILWCVEAYYQDLTLNVFEYLYYLQHLVRCMNWVDKHREEIEAMIRELP
jgi:homoserine kinase type II